MATSPVFREVIDVSFDQAGFAASVSQLIDAWQKGLDEMSSKGIDTSGLGALQISQITESLAQAKADLQAFATAVVDGFAEVAVSSAQSATAVADTQTNAASKVEDSWTKVNAKQLNQLAAVANQSEETYARFVTAVENAVNKGADFGKLDFVAQYRVMEQLTESIKNGYVSYDQLTVAQQRWYQSLAQVYGQAEERTRQFNEKQRVDFSTAWDEAIVADDKWVQNRGKVIAQAEAMNEKYNANLAKQQAETNYNNSGFGGKVASKFGDAFEDFGGQVAQIAAMETAFAAVNAPLAAIAASAQAISGGFKDGLTYLTQLEDEAAGLQGLLATNVKFADDTTQNFKDAGVAAKALHQDFEDAAIQYGVNVDVITRGFKSFVDNGGASLVNNVKEAADVSVLFAASLRAAGKDADTTRSLLSELPKLLDGTATSSSKILQTLDISTDQWNQMVTQAKTHKDLLEQLTPLLQNYMQVAEDSRDRFSAISDELKLIYDRTMAVVAQGIWDAFKETLKDVRDWLEANKDEIQAFAAAISDVIKSGLDMVKALLGLSGVAPIARSLAAIFIQYVGAFRQTFDLITGIVNASQSLKDVFTADNATKAEKAWRDLQSTVSDVYKTINEDGQDTADVVDRITNPEKYKNSSTDQSVLETGSGNRPPRNNAKGHTERLTALKEEYDLAEKYIEQQYNDQKHNTELLLAQRLISQQQAADAQHGIDEEEYEAQLNLVRQYQQKADEFSGTHKVSPEALQAFNASLDSKGQGYRNSHDNSEYEQQKKTYTQQADLQDKALQDQVNQTNKFGDAEIAAIKNQADKGLRYKSDGYAAMLEVAQEEHDRVMGLLDDEMLNAGANAEKQQAVLSKRADAEAKYTNAYNRYSDSRKKALLDEYTATQNIGVAAAKEQASNIALQINGTVRLGETSLEAAQKQQALAQAQLAVADASLTANNAEILKAQELGLNTDKLIEQQKQLTAARNNAKATVDKTTDQTALAGDQSGYAAKQLSDDLKTIFGDATDGFKDFGKDFANTVQDFSTAIQSFSKGAISIMDAFEKGGLAGIGQASSAIGGALQTTFAGAFAAAPVVGGILSAAGGLFTGIASLFTARAKEIADQISKTFKDTVDKLNVGQDTLANTIQELQQERASAISQLSGVKGGQDQLDKLLPEFDQEIAQLQQQQKSIIDNFNQTLAVMQAGGTELQDWTKSWQDINKQVQEYLDAGGDLNTANAYLQAELATLTTDLQSKLSDGQQTAIQDALQLNSLIQQRIDLIKQEQATEYGITSKDAIERRISTAVQTASDLANARNTFQSQLEDLNNQISLTSQKVALESQVFDLAKSTADLQAESNALTLDSLAQQVEQYKEMLSLVQQTSGYQFSGSFQSSIPGYSTTLTNIGAPVYSPIAIALNIDASGQNVNSSQFAGYLADALQSKISSARTSL